MPQVIQCCKNDRQTQLTNKNGRQSRPSGNACKGRKRPV